MLCKDWNIILASDIAIFRITHCLHYTFLKFVCRWKVPSGYISGTSLSVTLSFEQKPNPSLHHHPEKLLMVSDTYLLSSSLYESNLVIWWQLATQLHATFSSYSSSRVQLESFVYFLVLSSTSKHIQCSFSLHNKPTPTFSLHFYNALIPNLTPPHTVWVISHSKENISHDEMKMLQWGKISQKDTWECEGLGWKP